MNAVNDIPLHALAKPVRGLSMPPRKWRFSSGLILGFLAGALIGLGLLLLKPMDHMDEIDWLVGAAGVGAVAGIAVVGIRNLQASRAYRALERRRGYDIRRSGN